MAATEAKEAPKEEVEEASAPLRYKTWVLKVSIHCEGCKRKVHKVLKDIEGVFKVDIDLRQQRVVVIGNVESETLIKKLVKTGKHAELWPEKADSKQKKNKGKNKGKNKEKPSEQETSEESNHGDDKEKETVRVQVQVEEPAKNGEGSSTHKNGEGGNVVSEGGVATVKTGGQVKEPKPEAKQNVTVPAGSQSPVAEQKGPGDSENVGEKSGGGGGGGSGGKKKKKKAQKVILNVDGAEHSGDAPAATGSPNHGHGHGNDRHDHGPLPAPDNHIYPSQHVYHQYATPPHYSAPPVYATSYSRAYPSTNQVTTHFASPPPYSYTYAQPPAHGMETENDTEHPPYDYDYPSYSSHRPTMDSFELFSDENPNGCSVM